MCNHWQEKESGFVNEQRTLDDETALTANQSVSRAEQGSSRRIVYQKKGLD